MPLDIPYLHDPAPMEQPADDQQQRLNYYGAVSAVMDINHFGTSLNSILIERGSNYRIVELPSA